MLLHDSLARRLRLEVKRKGYYPLLEVHHAVLYSDLVLSSAAKASIALSTSSRSSATPASARALSLAPGAFLYLLVTSSSPTLAAADETSA